MAGFMFLGCFGFALGQSDTAQAATSSPMRVSQDGSIVWGTTSHANPDSGVRFHTIGWNFTIIRDGEHCEADSISWKRGDREGKLASQSEDDSSNPIVYVTIVLNFAKGIAKRIKKGKEKK